MTANYDVVVAGAGVSGICAALGARRQGASVLLVEKTGLTGGAITLAGVNAPAMFNAWGKQIIGGVGWELIQKCLEEEGKPIPDLTGLDAHDHVGSAIWVNPLLFSALCDEALLQAGVDVSLHTMPCEVRQAGNRRLVSLITKEGRREVTGAMLVDCTGDGDLSLLAGAQTLAYEECQPGTFSFYVSGFEESKINFEALGEALKTAVEAHELETGDVWWCGERLPESNQNRAGMWRNFLGRHGINANHVSLPDPDAPSVRTRFELAGRASMLRLWRFLKKQPGFESVQFEMRAPECGCRESRRILTEEIVTAEQYRNAFDFPEKIAYSFYPIDLHDDHCGLRVEPLGEGKIPSVPRGALLPKAQNGLLVAGRIIGSDRLANSALRIQATCMATGHAAGVWAALSALQKNVLPDPRLVPYQLLHDALIAQGAVL